MIDQGRKDVLTSRPVRFACAGKSKKHEVQYAFDLRKASRASGVAEDVASARIEADSMVERKQYVAREKKRMIAAMEAARIAYQARMIMATTAKGERQPGGVGAGEVVSSSPRTRRLKRPQLKARKRTRAMCKGRAIPLSDG